ncbi:pumilio homolog 12-like [Asparagus officinalis]|uniref:pumilio homolog 12-like n=1 Tax=Asparagus officinalis TaxID=4686 RepID=UPI00098E7A75|nr:pumilio homolog 12-like [Asparagus officinalis]
MEGLVQELQELSLKSNGGSPIYPLVNNLGFPETPISAVSDTNISIPRNAVLDSSSYRTPGSDFYQNNQYAYHVDEGYNPRSFMTCPKPTPESFENYLERCSIQEKAQIVNFLIKDQYTLVDMAKDPHSINFVKKVIESVKGSPTLRDGIKSALALAGINETFELMIHPIGYQLVSHCFNHLTDEDNLTLFETATHFCLQLATSEKGCASLKTCIYKSNTEYRRLIVDQIIANSLMLAKHYYGNFIIQVIIDLHNPMYNERICLRLKENLEDLVLSKSGSYVVEKCLKSSASEAILEGFISLDAKKLENIARHPFGNYALQTALVVSKNSRFHDQLVNAVEQLSDELSCDRHAKNVLSLVRSSRRRNRRY